MTSRLVITAFSVISSSSTLAGQAAARQRLGHDRSGTAGCAGSARSTLTAIRTFQPSRAPPGQVAERLLEDELSDRLHQLGLLGEGDELRSAGSGRGAGAATAAAPRSRTPRPVSHVRLRLVLDEQLAPFDRSRQFGDQVQAAELVAGVLLRLQLHAE